VPGAGGVTVGEVGAVAAGTLPWHAVHAPVQAACAQAEVVAVATPTRAAGALPDWHGLRVDDGVEAVLAIPLTHGEQRLGVLAVLLERGREVVDAELSVHLTVGTLVAQAITRTRLYAELRRQALHDGLTGLANRTLVIDRGEQALARTRRTGRTTAVLSIDLNGFKAVNDTWGHAAGDRLLTVTADRLVAAVRDVDTVGRLGGDEFVVLCEDVSPGAASQLAERVRAAIEVPVEIGGATVQVGASVGISLHDGSWAGGVADLLTRADSAMYAQKRSARDGRGGALPR
jgi:diguanylate cyclase (GGDEF)-like protein